MRYLRPKFFAIVLAANACLGICWADESGTLTLRANTSFAFEQDSSNTEADIFWNGVSLEPKDGTALFNLGNYGDRAFRLITSKHASRVAYTSAPILLRSLAPGDIFGVRTRDGKYAKVLVKSSAEGTLSLNYRLFAREAPAAPALKANAPKANAVPVINSLLNNYSYILPGLPNYGIAPGSIFVIFGNNLSSSDPPVIQSSASPGLPTTLNQTSISVTVNGVKTTPSIYYTSATAVAAVLPSNTPVGLGTATVSYNGTASLSAPIQVVASAPGLDTLYGTGNGAGVATDGNGNVFGLANSAKPGQTIILWGSGIGADTNNDDRTYPQKQQNQTSLSPKVFIGGIAASILYAGRSQFPGLDQYNVVVPPNVSLGCFVSVVMTVGADANSTLVSNAVTLPVSANGGACTDPGSGLSAPAIVTLGNRPDGTVHSLSLSILQRMDADSNSNQNAFLSLATGLPAQYLPQGYEYVSQGNCTVVPPRQGDFKFAVLDLGSVNVRGPAGAFTLTGLETAIPGANIPIGTYTFTGSGGTDVAAFKVTIDYQSPVTVTNKAALSTITRSSGVTINWTGGPANGDVQVLGWSGNRYGATKYICHAAVGAGQINIPPAILLALTAGTGAIEITSTTATTFTANGLDIATAAAQGIISIRNVYK